jgi:hypothetical protein
MKIKLGLGKGWHRDSRRHSNAKLYGKAGTPYKISQLIGKLKIIDKKLDKLFFPPEKIFPPHKHIWVEETRTNITSIIPNMYFKSMPLPFTEEYCVCKICGAEKD